MATAVLSTTARVKAREKIKEKEKQAEAMETVSLRHLSCVSIITHIPQDKPAEKAIEDVDMKDESSSISSTAVPLSASVTTVAASTAGSDDAGAVGTSVLGAAPPASPSKREKKPTEPSSAVLQNFSRVTPSQLAYIVFPPENRFSPVRAVAPSRTVSSPTGKKSDQYAGGGGILVLVDTKPEEGEPEWVLSLAEATAAATATAAALVTSAASQPGSAPVPVPGSPGAPVAAPSSSAADNEPNPDPPASFEVSEAPSDETRPYAPLSPPSFFSTLSIMILNTCAWLCWLALVYLVREH